jgi:uncharacterized protein YceK
MAIKRLALVLALVATVTGCSSMRTLSVDSLPPGADVFVDGKPAGIKTPAKVDVSAEQNEHAISVRKEGFSASSGRVRSWDKRGQCWRTRYASPVELPWAPCMMCCGGCLGAMKQIPGVLQESSNFEFRPTELLFELQKEGQGVMVNSGNSEDYFVYLDGKQVGQTAKHGRPDGIAVLVIPVERPGSYKVEVRAKDSPENKMDWAKTVQVLEGVYIELPVGQMDDDVSEKPTPSEKTEPEGKPSEPEKPGK